MSASQSSAPAAFARADRDWTAALGAPPNDGANMERAVLVYTTYSSVVEAVRADRAIVARRLDAANSE
jgi:hypothetical protein